MRIRINQTRIIEGRLYRPGDEIEMEKNKALLYIKSGGAIEITPLSQAEDCARFVLEFALANPPKLEQAVMPGRKPKAKPGRKPKVKS